MAFIVREPGSSCVKKKMINRKLHGLYLQDICDKMICEKEAQYEIAIQVEEEPVYSYADAEAVKRILKNMIDNAFKHGGAGKYLGIRLLHFPDKSRIEIEDHGAGINVRDKEQIFSRNYTTARKGTGSGLGLTIARNLARQMGADIEVYSEPGVRTVFTLIL